MNSKGKIARALMKSGEFNTIYVASEEEYNDGIDEWIFEEHETIVVEVQE